MEKLSEFLSNNWILVLIINILAITFIIIYIVDIIKEKKKTQKNYKNNILNTFDNKKYPEKSIIKKETVEKENNKSKNQETKEQIIINENKQVDFQESTKENTKLEFDEETKKQLHDNIDYIINQSNSVFEEFEKVLPEKIIDDDTKKELENFNDKINTIPKTKKSIKIDTDIKLPDIDLSPDKQDIWN